MGPFLLVPAAVLLLAACSNGGSAVRTSGVPDEQAAGASRSRVDAFLARYPATLVGQFGTSKTLAFDGIARPRLSDRPYGPRDGRAIRDFYSFIGLPGPVELSRRARLVVRGTVLAIGRPHFNSDDGAFWHPALHGEAGVTEVDNAIYRDVLFRVDEVWGSSLANVRPGSVITFLSRGGQLQVLLSDEAARKMELGSGGAFVLTSEPPVDLSAGEEAVLFLNTVPIDGLYNGRYGYKFELFPAHELFYKYTVQDGQAVNARDPTFNMPINELKAIVKASLAKDAGAQPREGTFPASPHPPVTGGSPPKERTEPPHDHGIERG